MPNLIPKLASHTSPDIIFLPDLEKVRLHTAHLAPLLPHERTIVCIEIGHAADGHLEAALVGSTEPPRPRIGKTDQHKDWLTYLVAQEWQVLYYPVIVSHSGLAGAAGAALRQCGVTDTSAIPAVRKVANHAVRYTAKFRNTRKKLYKLQGVNPPDPG